MADQKKKRARKGPGRPSKEGARRTIRFDPEVDAKLTAECERTGVDISGVIGLIVRRHFGLDGEPGAVELRDRLIRVRETEPSLRAAFKLLARGREPKSFKALDEVIVRVEEPAAVEVWRAWAVLR